MENKLDRYTDVLTRLLHETVACTPQEWAKGLLTIDCDGTRLDYKLKNEFQAGAAQLSEKLRDLIDELYVRMAHGNDAWTNASLSFFLEHDKLKYDIEFQYMQATGESPPTRPKPKWKFWQ